MSSIVSNTSQTEAKPLSQNDKLDELIDNLIDFSIDLLLHQKSLDTDTGEPAAE